MGRNRFGTLRLGAFQLERKGATSLRKKSPLPPKEVLKGFSDWDEDSQSATKPPGNWTV